MLASHRNDTLYIGETSNLPGRIWQHMHDQADGFTKRHGVHTLVWHEFHGSMESAILREKVLKEWKLQLIESANPQ